MDDPERLKNERVELLSISVMNASGVKLGHFLIISNILRQYHLEKAKDPSS